MTKQHQPSRTLAGIAGIVAIATLISKLVALVRQQAIAAAFGVGDAANAYSYAYVIPSFLLVLLGGVNGPIHSAIVSVLAKRDKESAAPLVETITTLVGGALLLLTIGLFIFADFFIKLVGPGLSQTAHAIATQQLRIMAPMAILSGLMGIGFGTLNTANQYWLLSLSPVFSSITIILGLGILALQLGHRMIEPQYALLGGMILAWGTLAGAILQWLVQQIVQWRLGLGTLRLRFNFRSSGVREVTKIMGPAIFSSGMLQINVYTDLFFASAIPGAGAAFNYANYLVQTPLGIISNIILLPLLPMLSRLSDPSDWVNLKLRIRQGLFLTAITMMPLGAVTVALAFPAVRVIYERGAFKHQDSVLVTSVLMAYGVGMFVYLARDILVRVFYALGDGNTPFRISVANIFLNALLDYFLVKPFGAPGLILATAGVNLTSTIMFLWLLDRRLNGLPWREWILPILGLIGSSIMAGLASWGSLWGFQQILGTEGLLVQLLQLCLSGIFGLAVFALFAMQLNLPEVELFVSRFRQRFFKR